MSMNIGEKYMKTTEYLDLAKKKHGFNSDNKLAIKLGWSRTKISNYRNLPQQMDNEAARQMAKLVEIPVLTIIADMEALRQKDPSKKRAWSTIAKMTKEAGLASTNLLINISLFSSTLIYCILCKIDWNCEASPELNYS